MTIAHLLEEFADEDENGGLRLISDLALEEERLAAFDEGFAAGWEDALKAQRQTEARVNDALADALEGAHFSYQEALAGVLENLGPVFETLLSLVLPKMIEETIGLRVLERLRAVANEATAQPVIVTVPPAFRPRLEQLLADQGAAHVALREGGVSAGIGFSVGTSETELDMDQLIEDVRASVDAFVHTTRGRASNG